MKDAIASSPGVDSIAAPIRKFLPPPAGLVLAALVFAACIFGIVTRPIGFLANFWPANAVMLGGLLAFPATRSRMTWIVGFAAFVLADFITGSPLNKAVLLTAANFAGIVTAYCILIRLGEEVCGLKSPLSVLYVGGAVAAGGIASGLGGSLVTPAFFGGSARNAFEMWMATEIANYVVVLPVILIAPRWKPGTGLLNVFRRRGGDVQIWPACALIASCFMSVIIGGPGAIAFPFPFLLWCALIYPVMTVAVLTSLISFWTMVGVAPGYIPMADSPAYVASVVSLRIGVAFTAIAPLILATVVEALDESMKAQSRLAAIVDSSYDAIISKNLDGDITSWNRSAEQLFGYAPHEIIGRPARLLFPDEISTQEDNLLGIIRRGETVKSFETIRRNKSGKDIDVSMTLSPLIFDGAIVGVSTITRDLTETKLSERRINDLMHELSHRVQNQLAVVQAIVRSEARSTASHDQFAENVSSRLSALSRAQNLLVKSGWKGVALNDLIRESLTPFSASAQASVSGPELTVQPSAVQSLGMAFHELGTNSTKYGALRDGSGRIAVTWTIAENDCASPRLTLTWDEESEPVGGGEADTSAPRKGFGSSVLQRVVPQSLNGEASYIRNQGHVVWTLQIPLQALVG